MIIKITMELHEVKNKYKKTNIIIKNNFVLANNNFVLTITINYCFGQVCALNNYFKVQSNFTCQ